MTKLTEYSKLSKINVPEPKQYLINNFPEGLPLATCYVASSVIQQVDASVDHALSNNSWIDVTVRYRLNEVVSSFLCVAQSAVEFQLAPKDVTALIKVCPSYIAASKEKKVS